VSEKAYLEHGYHIQFQEYHGRNIKDQEAGWYVPFFV